MERVHLNRKRTDMRYASPDGTRPNPELVERAQRNFIRQRYPSPPSPSTIPLPSHRLLAHPKSKSRSKSPKPITIQGRNRLWTVKRVKKPTQPSVTSQKSRKSTTTARGIKMKNRRRK